MSGKIKAIVAIVAIALVAGIGYSQLSDKKNVKQITINNGSKDQASVSQEPLNDKDVSPISGLGCENWNRRPLAVMQPADIQARPAAGFSEADMVIEMPAYTASNTRLMGIYVCNIPKEIGAIRSGRHDNIHLASGFDALYVHWGYSIFAENLLAKKVVDNINCLASPYCDRGPRTGQMRVEDTGRLTQANALKIYSESGYRTDTKFAGYPHQRELAESERPAGGHLRVAFAKPYDAEYDYDKATNSYLRTWGDVADKDKNNGQRIAPKNIVVMFAKSEQITIDQDYVGRGLKDPWAEVPEIKKTGVESISSRYNNLELGDPWYDTTDSGEAYYYMNGQQYRGSWKKDKSRIDSKLFFYDESNNEIKFVPGQVWVEILEPGQALKWEPTA